MQKKKSSFMYLAAAFLLPVSVMLAVYAWYGIYPFGDRSILVIDMNNQYISYFSYLKEALRGGHGFFYSFSKTLGGDMAGLTAYYLMSPLNLLMLFFPVSSLPTAVELITIIKLGLCGVTFCLCVDSGKCPWHSYIFSTAYALMSYNIVYQQNLMWLDGVVLLPLVILGIHKICCKKTPFLYIGALSASILINYYIGFMVCIFSVLYFVYYYFFCRDASGRFWDVKILFTYGAASVLSGGLCMWLLLPALKSLAGGKAVFSLSLLTMQANFHWSGFLVKFFPGSFDFEQVQAGFPNVFCGMAAAYFLFLFFLNRKISIQKKAGALALFLILAFSFYFHGANLIWHGFNPPAWFPYRYSFIFSFLMLLFAEQGFCRARECKGRELAGMSALALGIFFALACWLSRKNFPFMDNGKYLLGIGALAVVASLYLCYAGGGDFWFGRFKFQIGGKGGSYVKAALPFALLCVSILELWMNGIDTLKAFHYADYGAYREFIEAAEPAVGYVKELDQGLCRMEKTFHRKMCDPMLLDFRGLSHYSSTEKNVVKYFMGQAGFRNNGNWSYYNRGSTYAMDSLLGVKYILSKKPLGQPYQRLDEINGVSVYKNPYALPFGIVASGDVLSCGIGNPHKFELQNEIWHSLSGGEVGNPLFVEEEIVKEKLKNLQRRGEDPFYLVKKDGSKKASVEYRFTAQSEDPVFAWFGTNDMRPVEVRVNGKPAGKYFDVYNYDILRLGSFQTGETVKVKLILKEDAINITEALFYHQDMEVFSEYYRGLAKGAFEVESFRDDKIKGSASSQPGREYLLFTIPYEEGWKAWVDGKEVEPMAGLEVFLAVKIPDGTHQVQLRYIPPGLKIGSLLTVVSAMLLAFWVFFELKCSRLNCKRRRGDG